MADRLDSDFWDRLVTQPANRPPARTADDRIVLAIDTLLPDASSTAARERARARVLGSIAPLRDDASARDVRAIAPVRIASSRGADRIAPRRAWQWGSLAAAILLILAGIAAWWSSGNASLPFRTGHDDGGVISAVADQSWNVPMRGIDPGRTNAVPGSGFSVSPSEVWIHRVKGQVRTPPLAVDGIVYFGRSANSPANPGDILAVRSSDGSEIWSYPTKHGLSAAFLLDHDTLYAIDDGGTIYAIDALSGTQEWSVALEDRQPYTLTWYGAPLILDGTLIFSSGSALTVAAGNGAVFVGRPGDNWIEGDPHVYAVSPEDGSIVWEVAGFPGNEPQSLLALSIGDGSLLWSHSGSPAFLGPTYEDGTVYFGAAEPTSLVALDAQTGVERWRSILAQGTRWDGLGTPTITATAVLAGLSSGELVSVDKQTGSEQWTAHVLAQGQFGARMQSTVTVVGNQAIVVGDGAISGVDLISRSVVWHEVLPLDFALPMVPVVSGGVLFQAIVADSTDNGGIVALSEPAGSP